MATANAAQIQYALERLSSSFVALKPEQATCIQHVTEEKDVFMAAHGLRLIVVLRGSTSFIFDYQLNRDNSAVLVVSPLLLLMMEQVDGVQAEMASFHYRHCTYVVSNLTHAI